MVMFTESFDSYNGHAVATGGVATRWSGNTTSGMLSNTAGRFGGQAATISDSTGQSILTGISSTTFRFNFALRFVAGGGGTINSLGAIIFRAGSTAIFGIRSYDGVIYIHSGSTTSVLLGSIPNVPGDTWHTISGWVVISPTVGQIHVRVDSDAVKKVDLTSLNLGSTAFDTLFLMGGSSVGRQAFDDIVMDDSATADYLPELRIQTLAVTSDGGTLNLTPSTGSSHFGVVDEVPVSLTDYLSGTTVGHHDLLGVANLSVVPASIMAVKIVGYAAKTDAAARAWNLGLVSGATTSLGSNFSLTTTVQYYERLFEDDPDTATDWTDTGINALVMRPQIAV